MIWAIVIPGFKGRIHPSPKGSFWLEDIIVHMVPIDCAVYDLFYGPETWRRQQAAAFATTIRGSVDFFERKENPTFLIQKDSPKRSLKTRWEPFKKKRSLLLLLTEATKGSKFSSFSPWWICKKMLHRGSASYSEASIWPNPKAQTIKCPKRTVHGTHYYKSRECKNLRLSFQAFQVVCTTFEVPTQKVSIS